MHLDRFVGDCVRLMLPTNDDIIGFEPGPFRSAALADPLDGDPGRPDWHRTHHDTQKQEWDNAHDSVPQSAVAELVEDLQCLLMQGKSRRRVLCDRRAAELAKLAQTAEQVKDHTSLV